MSKGIRAQYVGSGDLGMAEEVLAWLIWELNNSVFLDLESIGIA